MGFDEQVPFFFFCAHKEVYAEVLSIRNYLMSLKPQRKTAKDRAKHFIATLNTKLVTLCHAGRVSTTDLVNIVFNFCEVCSGKTMYPYQEQFSKRMIRSVIENDGEELTALFARQTGKTETVADTTCGMMVILPKLANMPMFAGDTRLEMFKDGLWIGIFAPSLRQSQVTYSRIKARLQCKEALAILTDPEFNLLFTTSNGQTVALSNGSFATAISASDGSNIEGESFKFIICEEAQDISNYKVRKCLTGDTKVLLSTGVYKNIDSIVKDASDSVVCFNKEMQFRTSRLPSEFYDNGIQDVYELSLDNGESIKATLNHQFYTLDKKTNGQKCKYRTLQQIQDSLNNDRPLRVGIPDRLPYFAEERPLDYEKGLIVGYLLGDGCTVGTPKFIGDIPTCNRLHETICTVFGDVSMTETSYNPDNGMQEVCFSTPTNKKNSNPLTSFLKELEVCGLTKDQKCLPDKLFSQSFYKGYIEGLIETEGCVESCTTKPIVSFANVSLKMIKQLKDIYLKFGIHSTLFTKDNSGGLGENQLPLHLLHVKSVLDIRRFSENFVLFRKQSYLNEAIETTKSKDSREVSKYYSEEIRFCRVKSIVHVGKEPTYCLRVEGRNFIANNMVSSNSIHPMGAAYASTIVKIGTATTFKGDFYEAIQRNKKADKEKSSHIRNHFEYDWKVASKYNPKYLKYVESEKRRLGEQSDEFQMSYCLKWIISRSMFINLAEFELKNTEDLLERTSYDKSTNHVAGIDVGGKSDSTVITIEEVNWNMPVIMESRTNDETGEEETYIAYDTYLKDWLEIRNVPDYEEQYPMIVDYLQNFKISRAVVDATREASLAHRLRANLPFEVVPFIFTPKSKSEMYKHLMREINSGRARVCHGEATVQTEEYKRFLQQLGDLQQGYSGSYLVVHHPDEAGAHDDFPDSWALAVWGCSYAGETNNTETRDNIFKGKTNNESKLNTRIKMLTGKRRR